MEANLGVLAGEDSLAPQPPRVTHAQSAAFGEVPAAGGSLWRGNRRMVMKGVTIGENAVVAAGCLVTRDVPPYTMVVGIPASVAKNFQ